MKKNSINNKKLKALAEKIPESRRILIEYAVRRTIKEYGNALKKLSKE
jgi:hypothetical protein